MRSIQYGTLWSLFIHVGLWAGCQVGANPAVNQFYNSTLPSTTTTLIGTTTVFNTCFEVATETVATTITGGNTTVRSTTTTTQIVTLPPDAPTRKMIRAPLPHLNARGPNPAIVITTIISTVTSCGFTVTNTVTLVTQATQKITVDELITETQTVFVRGQAPVTVKVSTTSTTSSTPEAIPPVQQATTTSSTPQIIQPVQQITTTSSVAQVVVPVVQVTTTSTQAALLEPAASLGQITTTIANVPFTISTISFNTAIVVNDATLTQGQVLTTQGVVFSNGPAGLEVSTTASPGAIIASIFGITTASTSATNAIIGGQTLTSGGTLVFSGTTYLLPTGGTIPAIITGTFPTSVSLGVPAQGSGVVIDGATLTPGGEIVVSGTTYILPPGETVPVPIVEASFVPTATEGENSLSASRTGTEAGPSYVQIAGGERSRSVSLFAGLLALCGGVVQVV